LAWCWPCRIELAGNQQLLQEVWQADINETLAGFKGQAECLVCYS
jgi:hypothetical protein